MSELEINQKQIDLLINLYSTQQFSLALKLTSELIDKFPRSLILLDIWSAVNKELGNIKKAKEGYKERIKRSPNEPAPYNNFALVLGVEGEIDKAISNYRKSLILDPKFHTSCFNLANLFLRSRQDKKARLFYERTLAINPTFVGALNNNGEQEYTAGEVRQAKKLFLKALVFNPTFPPAYINLAKSLNEQSSKLSAHENFRRGLIIDPLSSAIFDGLGNLFKENTECQKSFVYFQKALLIEPQNASFHFNLGNFFQSRGILGQSKTFFCKSVYLAPKNFETWSNLGATLMGLGDSLSALLKFQRSLILEPSSAETYNNLGVLFKEEGNLEKALHILEKAIHIRKEYPEANKNISFIYLLQGRINEGFTLMEYRFWEKTNITKPPRIKNYWHAEESLEGKHIQIYEEQGLGDTIQFCRYIPMLQKTGAIVSFKLKKSLHPLIKTLDQNLTLTTDFSPINEVDFEVPLLSLPYIFGTSGNNIPANSPYLFADENRVMRWRNHLIKKTFKIGICWQGAKTRIDRGRSFPLKLFEKISTIKDVELISLHKGDGENQLAKVGFKVNQLPIDLDQEDYAFLDTAALIINCDLVISSDTAVAHLAGALGRPTWVALQYVPDWRWEIKQTSTPWYPSMSLYRQPYKGDWDSVFKEIYKELKKRISLSKGIRINA